MTQTTISHFLRFMGNNFRGTQAKSPAEKDKGIRISGEIVRAVLRCEECNKPRYITLICLIWSECVFDQIYKTICTRKFIQWIQFLSLSILKWIWFT